VNEPLTRRTAIKTGAALVATAALPFEAAGQEPKRPVIEAYTDQLSYAPGEDIKFHLSCDALDCDIVVSRIGPKPEVVFEREIRNCKVQPIPKDASSHGCNWAVTAVASGFKDLKSGYYSVEMSTIGRDAKPAKGSTFFVVRPKEPGKNAKILLQLATNTYNAYTNWGGYSLYAYHGRHKVQGRRVSFDRPQSSQFSRWEEPFVKWAEKNGYALDYCVNSDLEFRPELLKHYKLVLSVGHDEYWSAPMRDNLEAYICNGGNVAFFSGNTCCWQVRSEDNGRALACWKHSFGDDPHYKAEKYKTLTSLWSHHLVGRPENTLTGVGFLWGGYHRSHGQFMDDSAAFNVHRPDHWLFAGTKAKRGDQFGGGGKDKVVGYECDGCELTWKDGLPFPTHRDGTPKDFVVVATAPARWHPDDCEWYEKWQKGRTGNAVVGTYRRGGTVVTVGTTDWSHGLRGGDAVVARVTKNVLDRLGK
jgi:hypothetical protein